MKKQLKQTLIICLVLFISIGLISCKNSANTQAEFQQETVLSEEKSTEDLENSIEKSGQTETLKNSQNSQKSTNNKTEKVDKTNANKIETETSQTSRDTVGNTTTKGTTVLTTTKETTVSTKTNKETTNNTTTKGSTTNTTNQETTVTTTSPPTTAPTVATIRVTLSVDCSAAVNAGNETAQLISNNGTILGTTLYTLDQGSTVYDLIMSSGLTIGARDGYIYSIQSLGEFDVNGKGGWYYFVNGVKPSYGVMQYTLQAGDQVTFQYTLDY